MTKDRKYLLKELRLNKESTCSFDEAVGMMLGILKGADWFIDIQQLEELNRIASKGEECDFNEPFSLYDYLADERDDLVSAYFEAKIEQEPESILEQKLDAIEQFDTDYMKKAKVYWCLLEDEFVKTDSELRFVRKSKSDTPKITLTSLDKWWTEKQQEKDVLEQSIFKDMQQNVPKVIEDTDAELSLSERVTFGLLLSVFVKQSGVMKYGEPENATISAVHDALSNYLHTKCKDPKKQGNKSIRTRLTDAENALKDYLQKHL
jgi:hypothetical protein